MFLGMSFPNFLDLWDEEIIHNSSGCGQREKGRWGLGWEVEKDRERQRSSVIDDDI
jgi:hypothetical protein